MVCDSAEDPTVEYILPSCQDKGMELIYHRRPHCSVSRVTEDTDPMTWIVVNRSAIAQATEFSTQAISTRAPTAGDFLGDPVNTERARSKRAIAQKRIKAGFEQAPLYMNPYMSAGRVSRFVVLMGRSVRQQVRHVALHLFQFHPDAHNGDVGRINKLVGALSRFPKLETMSLVLEPIDLKWFMVRLGPGRRDDSQVSPNLSAVEFRPASPEEVLAWGHYREAWFNAKKFLEPGFGKVQIFVVRAARPGGRGSYPNPERRQSGVILLG
ncbi:hypothetical protein NKR23_g223 [Pleurostoma richardsiae]|uniref:Uncharacterized protein n=1 Tax=Pleurostoma richardsiae TaxID=41990 RepID=A0AA38S304_9PEZI|nr:hypothetical protein NKR23_g223 [Pleurostoma richardsiae]